MTRPRIGVVGTGAFGRNHVRVLSQLLKEAELTGVMDADESKADEVAAQHAVRCFSSLADLSGNVDAAVVATPTATHEAIVAELLGSGIDVLVEKPIAATAEAGERLARLAEENGQILQVGHLERFNPAVAALGKRCRLPLFFEVHRLSVFTPRSLDADVVLDLMIHDLDIVLSLTGEMPHDIRAAGISILSSKVDIANVRLAFGTGCIANLTASRVSTEQVRKLRLFQPGEYLTLDYKKQELTTARLSAQSLPGGFEFAKVPVESAEPLELELRAFIAAVRQRSRPKVDGREATKALHLAEAILSTIGEHGQIVRQTIERRQQ